jgi:hypothetical protein
MPGLQFSVVWNLFRKNNCSVVVQVTNFLFKINKTNSNFVADWASKGMILKKIASGPEHIYEIGTGH